MRSADLRHEMPPLLRLALPLILGELGWVAMSVVDTAMLGRGPDAAVSMGAASLAGVLFATVTFGASGLLLGLDTLISQAFGAREVPEANRWLVHGLALAVALSVALTVLFEILPLGLVHLHLAPALLHAAIPALRGLTLGVLPLMLYFTLRRYLQAGGHGRSIAFALVSANLINAAGDWLLIYGHHWGGRSWIGSLLHHPLAIPAFGVVGSSWSTSFSRLYLFLALLAALVLADRRHGYGLRTAPRRLEFHHLRRLFILGAPAGAQIFIEIAIFALVTALCATFGTLPLAGHEVALQVAGTTFMVPFAISAATSVRVGHALGRMRTGRGTTDEAAAAGWGGILLGGGFMLATSLVLLAAPRAIARLFTTDEAVIRAALPLLVVAAGFQFFDGLQITATGALRGAGRTAAPLWTQLVCYWAVGMPLGAALAFHWHMGAVGLWLGLLISLIGAAVILVALWQRGLATLAPEPRQPS